jgi:hypothetical protein
MDKEPFVLEGEGMILVQGTNLTPQWLYLDDGWHCCYMIVCLLGTFSKFLADTRLVFTLCSYAAFLYWVACVNFAYKTS